MIKRIEDEDLSNIRGGKGAGQGQGKVCKCINVCPCDGGIPGDNEASFLEWDDAAETRPGP